MIEYIETPAFGTGKRQYAAVMERGDSEVVGEWADTKEQAKAELFDFIVWCSVRVEDEGE